MSDLRFIAAVVLAAVIVCGVVIKLYTHSRLKDLESTYDTERPVRHAKDE